jgi:hypothetical protein
MTLNQQFQGQEQHHVIVGLVLYKSGMHELDFASAGHAE